MNGAHDTVHKLSPLPLAQMRLENGLAGLDDVERSSVLAWAVAQTMLRFADPKWSSVDFLSDVWRNMDALSSAPAAPASQE
jgi:hypothetical protein